MADVLDCALQKDLANPIFCSSERKRKRARRWLPQPTARVSSGVHSQFSALPALPPPLSKATAARRRATCVRWASTRRTSRTRAAADKFQHSEECLILPRMKRLGIPEISGPFVHSAVSAPRRNLFQGRGPGTSVQIAAQRVRASGNTTAGPAFPARHALLVESAGATRLQGDTAKRFPRPAREEHPLRKGFGHVSRWSASIRSSSPAPRRWQFEAIKAGPTKNGPAFPPGRFRLSWGYAAA